MLKDTPPARSDALGGISIVFFSSILTRVLGLASQVAVGWLLLPEDFGAYALAIAFTNAVGAFRGGGAMQIMIKRGESLQSETGLFFRYSLLFNLLAMSILVVISIPYLLQGSAVGIVLLGTAVSIPVGTHSGIYRAQLTVDRRFRELAIVNLSAAVVWQLSLVLFAISGFGALSFAVPPVLQALFESVATYFYTGRTQSMRRSNNLRARIPALFRQTRWIMLSSGMLALATTGDYFAVGLFSDARTVGIYYFAFQLIVAISTPINSAIEAVLPATLTSMDVDRARQSAAYAKAVNWICAVAVPIAILFALMAPLVVHVVWQGKWDMAAPLIQILCACAPAWLIVSVGRALIEAQGLWRIRFFMLAIYGIGGMTSAAIGTVSGGPVAIAMAVAIFYVSFAFILLFVLHRLRIASQVAGSVLQLVGLNVVAAVCALSIALLLPIDVSSFARDCVSACIFVVVSLLFNLLFLKDIWWDIGAVAATRLANLRMQFTAAKAS